MDLVRLQSELEALLGHRVDAVSLRGRVDRADDGPQGRGLAVSRSDKRLEDIREMCAKVASIVERGRPTLDADELPRLALGRAIEIPREAATRVSDETEASVPAMV